MPFKFHLSTEAGEILGVSHKLGDKRSSKDPAKKIVEPAAQFRSFGAGRSSDLPG